MVISSKFEKFIKHWQIAHPDYVLLDTNQFKEIACIKSVYQLCRSITNKSIKNVIDSNLKWLPDLPEWIGDTLVKKNKWLSWKESIIKLHRLALLAEAEDCRRKACS